MKFEESFGIIPLTKERGQWEVFLIQHRRGSYWGFPKGHAEAGESAQEAAFRELKEETNLDIVRCLRSEPFVEKYYFVMDGKKVSKHVHYFVAEVAGKVLLQKKEVEDGIWISFPDAVDKITHAEGKSILSQVAKILPKI